MKRIIKWGWIPAIILLATASFFLTHINIEGHYYSKLAHTLDVRQNHMSQEGYEALRAALPDCEILWDLPFQGQALPLDTKELTVEALSVEEVPLLLYLSELETVDGREAQDVRGLAELARQCPQCRVLYRLQVGDSVWESTASELTAENASAQALQAALPLFPEGKELLLTGVLPEMAEIEALRAAFPDLSISWEMTVNGERYFCDLEQGSVAGTASLQEISKLVNYLPRLQQLDIRDCRLSGRELAELHRQYPDVFFLADVTLFDRTFSTDAEEVDLSGNPVENVAELEALLDCFPNLTYVDMCGCGVDNEIMDALNRRHEDVSFVWTVKLGWKEVRTDIRWFMPFKFSMYESTNDETIANLRYCTELEVVDIGHMPVTNCDWAEPLMKLKYLIIGDGPMANIDGLKDHTKLIYLELFKVPVKDYTPLLSCTGLEDLNISYTYGDPGIIAQMTWLKNLWWQNPWTLHWQYQEGWDHLKENMPGVNISQYHSTSSTDHGWRELPNYFAQRDILGMFYMEG